MESSGRILSIQSHVCSGYVGNRAATFPLQLLGYDVDVINTVQFSNHSGYGRLKGTRTTAEELTSIFKGLDENGLLRPDRLLTGYVPTPEALSTIADLARRLRKSNPDMIYLLDPVMGDDDRLYVAPECVPIYKELLAVSTVITPNWFEVELLTGIKLDSPSSLRQALEVLHKTRGVAHVVISSLLPTLSLQAALPSAVGHTIHEERSTSPTTPYSGDTQLVVCSSASPSKEDTFSSIIHVGSIKRIRGYFSGVGDLFSALVLAHFDPTDIPVAVGVTPLSRATSLALSSVQSILISTHNYVETLPDSERPGTDVELDLRDVERRVRRMRARELRLIQGRDYILQPSEPDRMVEWVGFWV